MPWKVRRPGPAGALAAEAAVPACASGDGTSPAAVARLGSSAAADRNEPAARKLRRWMDSMAIAFPPCSNGQMFCRVRRRRLDAVETFGDAKTGDGEHLLQCPAELGLRIVTEPALEL